MAETTIPTDRDVLFHWVLDLLTGLLLERRAFVILELPRNRFVQALVDVDGNLQIESVSATYLLNNGRLDVADEDLLTHMGWRPPSDHSPNWHRTFVDSWPPPTAIAAEFLTATLLAVHGMGVEEPTITHGVAVPDHRVERCDDRCAA